MDFGLGLATILVEMLPVARSTSGEWNYDSGFNSGIRLVKILPILLLVTEGEV